MNFIENNTINKQGGMLTLEYIVRNISNVSINYSRENNVNLLTFEFLESFIDKNTEKCILDVSYELNTYNYDAKNKFIMTWQSNFSQHIDLLYSVGKLYQLYLMKIYRDFLQDYLKGSDILLI